MMMMMSQNTGGTKTNIKTLAASNYSQWFHRKENETKGIVALEHQLHHNEYINTAFLAGAKT